MLLALLVPALVALTACVLFLVRRAWRNAVIAALVCANILTLAGWLLTSHSRALTRARLCAQEKKVGTLEARIRTLESAEGINGR